MYHFHPINISLKYAQKYRKSFISSSIHLSNKYQYQVIERLECLYSLHWILVRVFYSLVTLNVYKNPYKLFWVSMGRAWDYLPIAMVINSHDCAGGRRFAPRPWRYDYNRRRFSDNWQSFLHWHIQNLFRICLRGKLKLQTIYVSFIWGCQLR